MGATAFTDYQPGSDLKTAYAEACNQAIYEHGSDSYNGTISTTGGASQDVQKPMTRRGAEWYAEHNMERGEKWGNCLAVPVAKDTDFTYEEVEMVLTLPATQPVMGWDDRPDGKQRPTTEQDARDLGVRAAFKRYGNRVHDISLKTEFKYDYEVVTPEGRGTTVYVVERGGGRYATRAEAVKAAKAQMEKDSWTSAIKIMAVKTWDGEGAAMVQRKTTMAMVTVVVSLATPVGRPETAGWLFFGWAAM